MSSECRHIQRRLADEGPALADTAPEVRAHLEECAACTAVLEGLARLDDGLSDLPSHDADDALVSRVLEAVQADDAPPSGPPLFDVRWALAASLLVGLLGLLLAGDPLLQALRRDSSAPPMTRDLRSVGAVAEPGSAAPAPPPMRRGDPGGGPAEDRSKRDFEYAIGDEAESKGREDSRPEGDAMGRKNPWAWKVEEAEADDDANRTNRSRSQEEQRRREELEANGQMPPERHDRSLDLLPAKDKKAAEPEPGVRSRAFRQLPSMGNEARPSATFQGTVTYRDGEEAGQPAPFVTVVLEPSEFGGPPRTALTDQSGSFRFAGLDPGTYLAEAVEPGYEAPASLRISLFPGDRKAADLHLVSGDDLQVTELGVQADKAELPKAADTRVSRQIDPETLQRVPHINSRVKGTLKLKPGVVTTGDTESDQISVTGGTSTLVEPMPDETGFADTTTRGRTAKEAPNAVGKGPKALRTSPPPSDPPDPVAGFLAERDRVHGLEFQPAIGYWKHTYLRGDPELRLLEARLADLDPRAFRLPGGVQPLLHAAARQNRQPFDPPREAAMAVYLHADKTHVEGPTRMLLQVGLQGTERLSGRRPALNAALVLDLRRAPGARESSALRALVQALAEARQPGDRFSLVVAGRPGGLLVPPGEFRHGPVTLALAGLFGDEPMPGDVNTLDLPQALRRATETVARDTDPETPLGASLVLLATPFPLGARAEAVAEAAHDSAVAGVPVSAVGVGSGVLLEELEEIALQGHGRRLLLPGAPQAEALVDRELHASGRVVARALRLRIRLDESVRLVGILGSEPLSAEKAERVRRAEQAVDVQVARSLGIRADRGRDEAGIQMVIPAFYAGDSHVLLLDVVATEPGRLAEVSLRYKDLVHFRNGVARDSLRADRSPSPSGPLERNVLKNLVARRVSGALRQASERLGQDLPREAAQELRRAADLVRGLRERIPTWNSDAELAADLRLLQDYTTLLTALDGSDDAENRRRLIESLRFASYRKLTETREVP